MVWAFEIAASQVERVKQRCLPDGLNFPMLEEYDFKNDRVNPTLQMDLRPQVGGGVALSCVLVGGGLLLGGGLGGS